MDIKAIAEQVMATLGEAPEKVQEFIADPAGMIEQITGHSLGEGEISQVVEHITSGLSEKGIDLANFDFNAIGDKLGGMLGESPLGDLGGMLGNIFGKKE